MVEPDSPQLTIWRMRISLWEPKATKTHSAYVTVIVVPLQQRLHERVSMLRHTYTWFLASRNRYVWLEFNRSGVKAYHTDV